MPRVVRGLLFVAILMLTAACGPGDPGPAVTPSASPAGSQQVSGTVSAGVEAGCLLLGQVEGEPWLLVGNTTSIKAGDQVTVEGRPQPDLMTTCQQGRPFRVDRVL